MHYYSDINSKHCNIRQGLTKKNFQNYYYLSSNQLMNIPLRSMGTNNFFEMKK